mmetsp:Transcript_109980/g.350226  ORF Transcript_109980/g.350226 Transcript_109980/m.350226 type:complete len:321 (+) Transcript_109980:103-1065(+)
MSQPHFFSKSLVSPRSSVPPRLGVYMRVREYPRWVYTSIWGSSPYGDIPHLWSGGWEVGRSVRMGASELLACELLAHAGQPAGDPGLEAAPGVEEGGAGHADAAHRGSHGRHAVHEVRTDVKGSAGDQGRRHRGQGSEAIRHALHQAHAILRRVVRHKVRNSRIHDRSARDEQHLEAEVELDAPLIQSSDGQCDKVHGDQGGTEPIDRVFAHGLAHPRVKQELYQSADDAARCQDHAEFSVSPTERITDQERVRREQAEIRKRGAKAPDPNAHQARRTAVPNVFHDRLAVFAVLAGCADRPALPLGQRLLEHEVADDAAH